MANLELDGRIKQKLAPQSGNSARGAWVKQDFVLEYQDGNFPSEVCFTAWGQDKVDNLAQFQTGDAVRVSFNIKAREYAGKWYNDLRVWKLSSPQAVASQTAAKAAASAPVSQGPAPQGPAISIADMPAESFEDLPF